MKELQYVKAQRLKDQANASYSGVDAIVLSDRALAPRNPDLLENDGERETFDSRFYETIEPGIERRIKRFLLSRSEDEIIQKILFGLPAHEAEELTKWADETYRSQPRKRKKRPFQSPNMVLWKRFQSSKNFRRRSLRALDIALESDHRVKRPRTIPPLDFSFVEAWAKSTANSRDRDAAMVAHAIKMQYAHIIEFDDNCLAIAREYGGIPDWIPFPVTLVRIPGHARAWGIAAVRGPAGPSIITIGAGDLSMEGAALLSFLQHRCRSERGNGPSPFIACAESKPSCRKAKHAKEGYSERKKLESALPFTRRSYYRRQHYGPGNKYVKIILIGKTVVNPARHEDRTVLPIEARTHRVILRRDVE